MPMSSFDIEAGRLDAVRFNRRVKMVSQVISDTFSDAGYKYILGTEILRTAAIRAIIAADKWNINN